MFATKEEELCPAGGALVPAGRGHFAVQKGKSAEVVVEQAIGMMVQGVYLYLLLVYCILYSKFCLFVFCIYCCCGKVCSSGG